MSAPRIELRYVAGCPNVEETRRVLRACLEQLGLSWEIVEVPGNYPSPTLGIDGLDVVSGEPLRPTSGGTTTCRLDLPTRARVLSALTREPR